MISIIICSRTENISDTLQSNIATTIGCDYELVVIDNSKNQHSIFTAYNEGVRRSHGDILCFMHDDILHHTHGWGNIISKHFQEDPQIGIIGVAGSHFMAKCPMYWWSSPYISQYNLENDNGLVKTNNTTEYFKDNLAEVVVCDGLCLFIQKQSFDHILFDHNRFSGFHGYDMDICMQVITNGKKCCVTKSILVEHFWSESLFGNKKYMELLDKNLLILYQKWENHLPLLRGIPLSETTITRLNNLCIQGYESKRIRRSKPYRLGLILLYIPKLIIKKLKNNSQ